jgi:cytoskeletal protein RodZ
VSIGARLTQARHQAGLTVAQVSVKTRIRQTIIRGIEADDYAVCGGDFYARGHIRSIAKTIGIDPEPLIDEYDTNYRAPGPASATSLTELLDSSSPPPARRGPSLAALGGVAVLAALVAILGFVVFHVLAKPPAATVNAQPVSGHQVPPGHTGGGSHPSPAVTASSPAGSPSPSRPAPGSPPGAQAAQTLTPAQVTAFGQGGAGHGDNASLASRATDGNPGTDWHSDWYTSANFGNLYPGTGLLLDMGRPVTITGARITVGTAAGAGLQLRVGSAPTLGAMPTVAQAAGASGAVQVRPSTAARGRYVLVWFTTLPQDPAGTYQVRVYDIALTGHP